MNRSSYYHHTPVVGVFDSEPKGSGLRTPCQPSGCRDPRVCALTWGPAAVLRRQRGGDEEGLRTLLWESQRGRELLQRPPEQRQALPGVCEGESCSMYYSSCISKVPSIVFIRWVTTTHRVPVKYQYSIYKRSHYYSSCISKVIV